MRVGNAQEIVSCYCPHIRKSASSKKRVVADGAYVLPPIVRNDHSSKPSLARCDGGVDRHESAACTERRRRHGEETLGAQIIEVVNKAECKDHIESTQVSVEVSDVSHAKLCAPSVSAARPIDVCIADVDPDIPDVA
jgi:hypothetical protein